MYNVDEKYKEYMRIQEQEGLERDKEQRVGILAAIIFVIAVLIIIYFNHPSKSN